MCVFGDGNLNYLVRALDQAVGCRVRMSGLLLSDGCPFCCLDIAVQIDHGRSKARAGSSSWRRVLQLFVDGSIQRISILLLVPVVEAAKLRIFRVRPASCSSQVGHNVER